MRNLRVFSSISEKIRPSKMICRRCESDICDSNLLYYFTWRKAMHLTSNDDDILGRIKCIPHSKAKSWKKLKLHCANCNADIGLYGQILGESRALFKANSVSFDISSENSPILSESGYPQATIRFTSWKNMYDAMRSNVRIKEALGIQEKYTGTRTRSEYRRRINLCQNAREVIALFQQNGMHENPRSIVYALNRLCLHIANSYRTIQLEDQLNTSLFPNDISLSKSSVRLLSYQGGSMSLSEAPEDSITEDMFALKPNFDEAYQQIDVLRSPLFENFVNHLKKHLSLNIHAFDAKELSIIVSALSKLGYSEKNVFRIISQHICSSELLSNFTMTQLADLLEAYSSIGFPDQKSLPWFQTLMEDVAKDLSLRLSLKDPLEDIHGDIAKLSSLLSRIAHSFIVADHVDNDILDKILECKGHRFEELKRHELSQLYEVKLSRKLNSSNYGRLHRYFVGEEIAIDVFESAFRKHQAVYPPSQLQLSISSLLDEMAIEHQNSYIIPEGYRIDIAVSSCKVGIEIHVPTHFNTDGSLRGSPRMKMRHLNNCGWKMISISHEKWSSFQSREAQKEYLHLELVLATSSSGWIANWFENK